MLTILLGLLLAGWAYGRGYAASPRRTLADHRRAWRFALGLLSVAIALVSPLEPLARSLASAHMVQHLLLVLVAAPLIALSGPFPIMLRGAPPRLRRAAGRWRRGLKVSPARLRILLHPGVAWLAHAGALWLWHSSVMYGAALRNDATHMLEHASFLGTALLFWSVVVQEGPAPRTSHGTRILLVFTMAMQGVLLGVLLTFAGTPWYAGYATTTAAWGLDPLTDQQLAGVLMWIPGGIVYLTAALLLLAAWIRDSEPSSTDTPR